MSTDHPLESIAITFPEGVYADVRLEQNVEHRILLRDGVLEDVQARTETGALIRVLKNGSWLVASTTDLDGLDACIADLARSDALAPVDTDAGIDGLQIHQETAHVFDDERVDRIPVQSKLTLLDRFTAKLGRTSVRTWSARWLDVHRDRRFVSSLGADVRHDYQECGLTLYFTVGAGSAAVSEPEVAGVFAHESFGHKSEADFMLGDPAMLEAWAMGTPVASEMVTITDGGGCWGSGYMPYDDEGQKTGMTHLITDGMLTGRLHSAMTARALGEAPTGNARAISFRYEPIVRMTTTTIAPGDLSREELFAGVEDGYFIETVKHGSGMSTFTIAPGLCWRIRQGVLAEPVRIAVITGTVFETLQEIDGLSDQVEVPFLVGGGCGKMEQWPLSVGFGGPYVRVRAMRVA